MGNGSRPRVRATTSKDRLFDASMRLFGARSPEAVSVDEIAAAAGVSKGTVYYNFGSKDALISQILEFGAQKLLDRLAAAAAGPDAYAALRAMCEVALDFMDSYPSFAQLWIQNQLPAAQGADGQAALLHGRIAQLIIAVLDRLVVMEEAEKLPLATALFGAALFTSRLRAAGAVQLEREPTITALMRSVDGLLATHPRAAD